MKRYSLYLLIVFTCFPIIAFASINPMELCPQLYMASPAYVGSVQDCKKVWDYYVKTKNYCGMTLMTFDGEGGRTASIDDAKKYAQQLDINEPNFNTANSDHEVGCSKANVMFYLAKSIDYLTYLHLREGVDSRHNIDVLTYQYDYQIKLYDAQHAVAVLINKLPKAQAALLQTTWDKYQTLLGSINGNAFPVLDDKGALDGLRYVIPAREAMLKDFQDSIANLIQYSPKLPDTTQVEVAKSDQQLNMAYKKLPRSEALVNFERAWMQYKDAYLNFALSYYSHQYQPEVIKQVFTVALIKEQLKILNSLQDYRDEM